MGNSKQPEQHFPIKLTQAQRKAVAGFAPSLADWFEKQGIQLDGG